MSPEIVYAGGLAAIGLLMIGLPMLIRWVGGVPR